MKILKFIRDIILMLYVCLFILFIVCYFFGISAAVVTSPNQFSNIEVGSLVLFRSGEFFGSLPWFGHVVLWIKTIPGIIISSVFTLLIFGTFIFEIIRDKKNKKKNKNIEVTEDTDIDEVNEFAEEDIKKAKKFFSKNKEHIENEKLIEEFDEQRLANLNNLFEENPEAVSKDKIEEPTIEESTNVEEPNNIEESTNEEVIEEEIIEEEDNVEDNEDVVENKEDIVENEEDIVKEEEAIVEDNDDSITNGKDEDMNMINNEKDIFTDENDLNFDEDILNKYFSEDMEKLEDRYLDDSAETIPDDVIKGIEKSIDEKVYEAKHSVEELSHIPDSINRDTVEFENLLNDMDDSADDDIEYRQMTLAELEEAKEDPILSGMDFSESHIPEKETEVPEEFVKELKKELDLKNEEVRILQDKLTSLENIEMAEVSTKLKIAENEKAELAKEVSLKDEVIAELNEHLNNSKTYVKEVESALNTSIDERENLKTQLDEFKNTVSKYDNVIAESNEKMDKYINKYNLIYERYISTIEYLVKKGLVPATSIDREKDTFNLNV